MTYLEHHGIKGMHWGVRRYRNQDGTLTEAGKKRYSAASKTEQAYKDWWDDDFYGLSKGRQNRVVKEYGKVANTLRSKKGKLSSQLDDYHKSNSDLYDQMFIKYENRRVSSFDPKQWPTIEDWLENESRKSDNWIAADKRENELRTKIDRLRSQISEEVLNQLNREKTEAGMNFVAAILDDGY